VPIQASALAQTLCPAPGQRGAMEDVIFKSRGHIGAKADDHAMLV
jgi:hypothetical protein